MPIAPLRTLAPQRSPLILPDEIGGNALLMPFNEGVGNPQDYSGYNSHGTRVGAVWAPDSRGRAGQALDFTRAIPSYVEIPAAHTQLDFTSEDFSIIVRLKSDTTTATAVVFLRGKGNLDGYQLTVDADGVVALNTFQAGASQKSFTDNYAIVAGTWYTVGISRDGASVIICRNGVDITTTSGTHTNPKTSARSVKIGIWDDKASFGFDGRLEFLRVFKGIALSASEHMAYHLGARMPNTRSLAVVR